MKIRNTALASWKDCRRHFSWTWLEGWRLPGHESRKQIGTAMHAGIAAYYSSGESAALEAVAAAYRSLDLTVLSGSQLEDVDLDSALAEGMMRGYCAAYPRDEWKWLAAEQPFELELGNGHSLTGTIDGLCRRADGRLWVVEHKTAGQIQSGYFDRASIDWQVHGYMLGAQQVFGEMPRGIVYNVVRRTALRLKKAETRVEYVARVAADYLERTAFYFGREEILLGGSALRQYLADLRYVVQEIRETPSWGRYPNTGSCLKWGRCTFLDVCRAGNTPADHGFVRTEEVIAV